MCRLLRYPCLFLLPPVPWPCLFVGWASWPFLLLSARAFGVSLGGFFLSLSVGCSRGFFFCCLPFSFSSFCCLVGSPCRGVSPRLVCVFSLRPCLGLWFFGSAVVSRGSFGSCSCVGVGCLSPFCPCLWCACLPRRSFWLVFFAVVLRRGSCFCSRSCCVSLSCSSRTLPCPSVSLGGVFRLSSWALGSPPFQASSWVAAVGSLGRPCPQLCSLKGT